MIWENKIEVDDKMVPDPNDSRTAMSITVARYSHLTWTITVSSYRDHLEVKEDIFYILNKKPETTVEYSVSALNIFSSHLRKTKLLRKLIKNKDNILALKRMSRIFPDLFH